MLLKLNVQNTAPTVQYMKYRSLSNGEGLHTGETKAQRKLRKAKEKQIKT